MVSIHTNLSSLIAQGSLTKSTNTLNRAIEQMSTGYKINHASDNAANYSIKTNMDTKIGAYEVAAENVAMGIDLVTTASDIVSQMQNKGERLRSLCVQARNGTYGTQSLEAINSEANALVSEINRLYITSEYNGMKLFEMANGVVANQTQGAQTYALTRAVVSEKPEAKAEYGGFISDPKTYEDSYVNSLTAVSSATLTSGGKYKITSGDDINALGDFVRGGGDTTNMTFILANDVDMSGIRESYYIGDRTHSFSGTIDGNGHSIKNLSPFIGMYGSFDGFINHLTSTGIVKNLAFFNPSLHAEYEVACIVETSDGLVDNCFVAGGSLTAEYACVGVIALNNKGTINNCYVEQDSLSFEWDNMGLNGGLVSYNSGIITNSFCIIDEYIHLGMEFNGGLAAENYGSIDNCYVTANIKVVSDNFGGLVGYNYAAGTITNSEFNGSISGDVDGNSSYVGGIAGNNEGTVQNCQINNRCIEGEEYVGGLVGYNKGDIIDSTATGTVTGTNYVGGLVGYNEGNIINSNTSGTVSGTKFVGGLVGQVKKTSGSLDITNSGTDSTVTGSNADSTGNFIGGVVNTTNETTFGTVNISGCTMLPESATAIGGCFKNTTKIDYDMSAMLAGINAPQTGGAGGGGAIVGALRLQVGVDGKDSSGIFLDTTFGYDLSFLDAGVEADGALEGIDLFIKTLSEKMTHYGTITNRLESALDTISVNQENLISSLSTIRDADMGEVSATYIQQQILQQASATLMATANQTPAIALQLI